MNNQFKINRKFFLIKNCLNLATFEQGIGMFFAGKAKEEINNLKLAEFLVKNL